MRKNDFKKLCDIFADVKDGDTVVLDKDYTYDVWQDDCLRLTGYHCSNTATFEENPFGERPSVLHLKGLKNVIVDGNGATILCHGIFTPIVVDDCENVTFKNLSFDYARPTMSETFVKSCENGVYTLEFSPETLFEVDGDQIYFVGEKGLDGKPYFKFPYKSNNMLSMQLDDRRLTMLRGSVGDGRPSIPTLKNVKQIGDRTITAELKNSDDELKVGSIIQTRSIIRDQVGGLFQRSKNVVLKDCHFYAMHGFGIMFQFVENATMDGVKCMPKKGRTNVSNADVVQFMNCGGRVTVKNCSFEGAHDDHINVHGTYLAAIKDEKGFIARFMHSQSRGFRAFEVGDKLALVDKNTMERYEYLTVKTYEQISDTDTRLEFEEDSYALREGNTVVENMTWSPEAYIENNYFGYNAARGILCSTPKKAVIKNNVFEGNCSDALICDGRFGDWYESGIVSDVEFVGNTIKNGLHGAWGKGSPAVRINPFATESRLSRTARVVFRDNSFVNCGDGYKCELLAIDELTCENNSFDASVELIK